MLLLHVSNHFNLRVKLAATQTTQLTPTIHMHQPVYLKLGEVGEPSSTVAAHHVQVDQMDILHVSLVAGPVQESFSAARTVIALACACGVCSYFVGFQLSSVQECGLTMSTTNTFPNIVLHL